MAVNFTTDQLLKFGEIAPDFQQVLSSLPTPDAPPPGEKDEFAQAKEARKGMDALFPDPGSAPGHIIETNHTIPVRDGAEIPIRIYSPKNSSTDSPLVINYHGGGFFVGGLNMGTVFCRDLVTKYNAVVVDVDYRLAPEYRFPIPINDSYDAMKWVLANAASLKANPELGFVLAGASAGGNIVAVLAQHARDDGISPSLTGQFLSIPATFSSQTVPERFKAGYLAYEQNAHAPGFDRAGIEKVLGFYKPDHNSPDFAPILDPKGLKGLPKAYIAVAGLDPLRDDGILYAKALQEEGGVEARLDVYPGLTHGWWMAAPKLPATSKYHAANLEAMGWLLKR